jgi:hypothetical protein|tara:strand:+ start:638 stop:1924 length:1287 start_codon:yes stop_codon:yes gene_type:complete
MINDDDEDGARAAARARLAARAAHGEGGMAAQAAAEAAVASVECESGAGCDLNVLDAVDMNATTPGRPGAAAAGAQKRKHIISPPMKMHRRKGAGGAHGGVNVQRAARDLCGDLGEPKESLMRRAIDVIGVVDANDLAITVGNIEGAGGQMTSDGSRRRTPGGVFWSLLKQRATKEDWDFIFEEEKDAQRERCRRRRRAASLNGSPVGTPVGSFLNQKFASALSGLGTNVKTPFANAGVVMTGAKTSSDAPARISMAARLSKTNTGVGVNLVASAPLFTPAAGKALEGSWAARAAVHTPANSMRRALSAPASSLAAAASDATKAAQDAMDEDDFAVTTPDNDPAVANATPDGSYAARARAAAAAEAEARAVVKARAAKIAAANAAAAVKLAPVALAHQIAAAMEKDAVVVVAPASAWGVSFASMLRTA